MIYYDIHAPESLSAAALDEYLAMGWYRMQEKIFTTDVIIKDNSLLPVFWLRLSLASYTYDKKAKAILAKNKGYTVACHDFQLTEELEQLFQLYKAAMDFDIAETLQQSLLGDVATTMYHTKCITIHDGETLIAAGFFDCGSQSIAGILNIYHPAYANASLGKYLMLLKIAYAQEQQLTYYYGGYLSTRDDKFDYKLFTGKESMEVYNRRDQLWVPWLSVTNAMLEGWLIPELENDWPES